MKKSMHNSGSRVKNAMSLIMTLLALFLLLCFIPALRPHSPTAQEGIPTGEYFIVNDNDGQALTPVNGGVNENVYLSKFKKSGMQKWLITQKISKTKSGKIVYSYTIRHTASGFYLRPYFVPANHSAIISAADGNSIFSIEQVNDGYVIKSKAMGGDTMYSKKEYSSSEAWFGPSDEVENNRWKIIGVNAADE